MRAKLVGIGVLVMAGCEAGTVAPTGGASHGSGGAGGSSVLEGGSLVDATDSGSPSAPDASLDDAPRAIDGAAADAPIAVDVVADVTAIDAPTLSGCDPKAMHARADQSLANMLVGFWNGTANYIDAAEPTTSMTTGYWTFAQAFDAVLDGVERTSQRHYRGLIATLFAAQNARGWSSQYYDDENWMALALLRAFDATGERAYLDRAVSLYAEIMAAWDDTSASPGGIWWNRAHTQKATASNAGPVITGARLAAKTGDSSYLAFARKAYDFWYTKTVDPATHKVADHVLPDGTVVRGLLTYNEGLMSGAALALHLATGEARFLTDAHGIAGALVKNEAKPTALGPVLTDGTNTGCVADCAQWKGIGYRYLALLFRFDTTHADYRTVLEASTEAAWTLARNASTGFFANDWRGPSMPTAIIEAQSSSAMALNLYAELCGPYPGDPTLGYEAEDAHIDHVSLESAQPGFSGWGYVSGWTANQQFVEFTVQSAAAGDHDLTFAYAAADDDATRSLAVNGAASGKVTFPSTGAWTSWRKTSVKASLSAGANLVRLTYDTTSAKALNLDSLSVSP